jgi:hypothetical protein
MAAGNAVTTQNPKTIAAFSNIEALARSYHYEPSKWATLRTENVENVAARYMANPNLVYIISDKKLAGNELVLLRKEQFESMQKVFNDLLSGQAAIQHNMETLMYAANLLEEFVAKNPISKEFQNIVGIVRSVSAQINSCVIVKKPILPIRSSDLSEEEKALVDE